MTEKNMALAGEYEIKMALIKEEKPRDCLGKKVETCGDCPRLWKNYKKDTPNFCTAMGFSIENLDKMERMCPYPLYKESVLDE